VGAYVSLDVELDLAEDDEKTPRWQAVRLLFVRGLKEPADADAGKKDRALFLTTDVHLSMSKMLEVYALRWGIEVYFNEAKQHLGFLQEQTAIFASHTASIHLCAIRYLMLMHNKHECKHLWCAVVACGSVMLGKPGQGWGSGGNATV
jgi:IS4 transposase